MTPSIQNAFNEVCRSILSFIVENSMIDQREREMLNLYVFENISMDRIAASYGLSKERTRQLILSVLRRIKSEAESIESEYIDLKNTSYNVRGVLVENICLKNSLKKIASIISPIDVIINSENNSEENVILENGNFGKKLVDFDLSTRALNCLKEAKIETVGQLIRHKKADLLKYPYFGKKSLAELSELLASLGLSFLE